MSVPERRAMVERPAEDLSVRRQCAMLNLAVRLPPQAGRRGGRSGLDTQHRRTASRVAVLRLAASKSHVGFDEG
jgi:hypothetical protein